MISTKKLTIGWALLSCLGLASAATTTQSGTFLTDDTVLPTYLTLTQSSNVQIYTTSYASGGFVPVLSLFDANTGNFIAVDGGSASCANGRMADASTGLCNDAFISQSLMKGTYEVVLTEFDNFPNGPNISDGFFEGNKGNFTSSACSGASGPFWETDLAPCVQRTGNYSVTTSTTVTPEPATAWLALPTLGLLGVYFRKVKVPGSR